MPGSLSTQGAVVQQSPAHSTGSVEEYLSVSKQRLLMKMVDYNAWSSGDSDDDDDDDTDEFAEDGGEEEEDDDGEEEQAPGLVDEKPVSSGSMPALVDGGFSDGDSDSEELTGSTDSSDDSPIKRRTKKSEMGSREMDSRKKDASPDIPLRKLKGAQAPSPNKKRKPPPTGQATTTTINRQIQAAQAGISKGAKTKKKPQVPEHDESSSVESPYESDISLSDDEPVDPSQRIDGISVHTQQASNQTSSRGKNQKKSRNTQKESTQYDPPEEFHHSRGSVDSEGIWRPPRNMEALLMKRRDSDSGSRLSLGSVDRDIPEVSWKELEVSPTRRILVEDHQHHEDRSWQPRTPPALNNNRRTARTKRGRSADTSAVRADNTSRRTARPHSTDVYNDSSKSPSQLSHASRSTGSYSAESYDDSSRSPVQRKYTSRITTRSRSTGKYDDDSGKSQNRRKYDSRSTARSHSADRYDTSKSPRGRMHNSRDKVRSNSADIYEYDDGYDDSSRSPTGRKKKGMRRFIRWPKKMKTLYDKKPIDESKAIEDVESTPRKTKLRSYLRPTLPQIPTLLDNSERSLKGPSKASTSASHQKPSAAVAAASQSVPESHPKEIPDRDEPPTPTKSPVQYAKPKSAFLRFLAPLPIFELSAEKKPFEPKYSQAPTAPTMKRGTPSGASTMSIAEQREMRRKQYLEDKERREAIRIQSLVRGYLVRKKFPLPSSKKRKTKQNIKDSTPKSPPSTRGEALKSVPVSQFKKTPNSPSPSIEPPTPRKKTRWLPWAKKKGLDSSFESVDDDVGYTGRQRTASADRNNFLPIRIGGLDALRPLQLKRRDAEVSGEMTVAEQREKRRLAYKEDLERRESVKIQSAIRGYMVRKSLGLPPKQEPEEDSTTKYQKQNSLVRFSTPDLDVPDSPLNKSQSEFNFPSYARRPTVFRNDYDGPPMSPEQPSAQKKKMKWLPSLKKLGITSSQSAERQAPQSPNRAKLQRQNSFDRSLYIQQRMYRDEQDQKEKTLVQVREERRQMYLRDLERREAIKIQSVARGFLVRRRLRPPEKTTKPKAPVKIKKDKGSSRRKSDPEPGENTTKAGSKGSIPALDKRPTIARRNSFDRSTYLISRLQREEDARQTKTMAEIREERRKIYLQDLERREATKIQALVRGNMVRNRYIIASRQRRLEEEFGSMRYDYASGDEKLPTKSGKKSVRKRVKRLIFGKSKSEKRAQLAESQSHSQKKNEIVGSAPFSGDVADEEDFFGFADQRYKERTGFFEMNKYRQYTVETHGHTEEARNWTGRKSVQPSEEFDKKKYWKERKERDKKEKEMASLAQAREEKLLAARRDLENREATKIQAVIRGFLVRKPRSQMMKRKGKFPGNKQGKPLDEKKASTTKYGKANEPKKTPSVSNGKSNIAKGVESTNHIKPNKEPKHPFKSEQVQTRSTNPRATSNRNIGVVNDGTNYNAGQAKAAPAISTNVIKAPIPGPSGHNVVKPSLSKVQSARVAQRANVQNENTILKSEPPSEKSNSNGIKQNEQSTMKPEGPIVSSVSNRVMQNATLRAELTSGITNGRRDSIDERAIKIQSYIRGYQVRKSHHAHQKSTAVPPTRSPPKATQIPEQVGGNLPPNASKETLSTTVTMTTLPNGKKVKKVVRRIVVRRKISSTERGVSSQNGSSSTALEDAQMKAINGRSMESPTITATAVATQASANKTKPTPASQNDRLGPGYLVEVKPTIGMGVPDDVSIDQGIVNDAKPVGVVNNVASGDATKKGTDALRDTEYSIPRNVNASKAQPRPQKNLATSTKKAGSIAAPLKMPTEDDKSWWLPSFGSEDNRQYRRDIFVPTERPYDEFRRQPVKQSTTSYWDIVRDRYLPSTMGSPAEAGESAYDDDSTSFVPSIYALNRESAHSASVQADVNETASIPDDESWLPRGDAGDSSVLTPDISALTTEPAFQIEEMWVPKGSKPLPRPQRVDFSGVVQKEASPPGKDTFRWAPHLPSPSKRPRTKAELMVYGDIEAPPLSVSGTTATDSGVNTHSQEERQLQRDIDLEQGLPPKQLKKAGATQRARGRSGCTALLFCIIFVLILGGGAAAAYFLWETPPWENE